VTVVQFWVNITLLMAPPILFFIPLTCRVHKSKTTTNIKPKWDLSENVFNRSVTLAEHRYNTCLAVVFDYFSLFHQLQLSRWGKISSRTQTTATAREPAHAGPQENLRQPVWGEHELFLLILVVVHYSWRCHFVKRGYEHAHIHVLLLQFLLQYHFVFWVNFIFTKPVPFTVIPILECSPLIKSQFLLLWKWRLWIYIFIESSLRNL